MDFRKIWLIARREYLTNVRRPSYLFTAFGLPVFIGVVLLFVGVLVSRAENDVSAYKGVGVVDKANVLTSDITLEAPLTRIASEGAAQQAMRDGTLDGYYVIPANYLSAGQIESYNRSTLGLNNALENRLEAALRRSLAAQIGDPVLAERLRNPLSELGIYRIGSTNRLAPEALFATFFVPLMMGMVIFIGANSTSQFLMSGLVEEKENRMMELFVTSARPGEMLWGKLLGLGALGLTQMLIWLVSGLGFAALSNQGNLGRTLSNLQLTPDLIALLLIYFLLAYMLNSAIVFSIGASVSADQESRQVSGLVALVFIIPYMLIFTYITNPNGPVPVFLSLFPLTAPVGMTMRLGWTSVPPIQIAVSIVLLALAVVGLLWLAARFFRLGMLNYGKRLSLGDVFRSIREERTVQSVAKKGSAAYE